MDKWQPNINFEKICYYLNKGWNGKDWYSTESIKLLNLLPEFEELPILKVFAVTSMTTSIEANVHLAIKALLQMKNKIPFVGYLPNQIKYLKFIEQNQFIPGRKIRNFIEALEGNINSVVVDIWICRAFDMAKRRKFKNRQYWLAPTKKEYDFMEDIIKQVALVNKIEPRQVQSAIWIGIKQELGIVSRNVGWSDLLIKKKGMFSYEM